MSRNHIYIALAILFVVVCLVVWLLELWTLLQTYANPDSPQYIDS